jgi:hypothetical protein
LAAIVHWTNNSVPRPLNLNFMFLLLDPPVTLKPYSMQLVVQSVFFFNGITTLATLMSVNFLRVKKSEAIGC